MSPEIQEPRHRGRAQITSSVTPCGGRIVFDGFLIDGLSARAIPARTIYVPGPYPDPGRGADKCRNSVIASAASATVAVWCRALALVADASHGHERFMCTKESPIHQRPGKIRVQLLAETELIFLNHAQHLARRQTAVITQVRRHGRVKAGHPPFRSGSRSKREKKKTSPARRGKMCFTPLADTRRRLWSAAGASVIHDIPTCAKEPGSRI